MQIVPPAAGELQEAKLSGFVSAEDDWQAGRHASFETSAQEPDMNDNYMGDDHYPDHISDSGDDGNDWADVDAGASQPSPSTPIVTSYWMLLSLFDRWQNSCVAGTCRHPVQ